MGGLEECMEVMFFIQGDFFMEFNYIDDGWGYLVMLIKIFIY